MLGESIIEYIKLIQSKRISKNIKASSWDSVSVNYSLYVMSGDIRLIYDTSIESLAKKWDIWNQSRMYEPLTFTIGQQQMIPGFEAGVVNMYLWEKKTITVFAKDGYGEKDLKLIKHVEKTVFTDAGIEPKVGESYNIWSFPWKVLTIEDSSVTIDFNHYLAGKTLYFDVELKSVDKK
jgi:FKBP-type peptidyl-prolyl cis-trans isomerase 2